MIFALRKNFFDVLFPPVCIACSRDLPKTSEAPLLCKSCADSLTPNPQLHCSVCRRRLPFGEAGLLPRALRCHPSASHLVFSAISYENPAARALIWHLKFKRRTKAAKILGGILRQALAISGVDLAEALVVPLPLSAARLRDRGFNQAELIAHQLQTPLKDILVRIKNTAPQSDIKSWEQRRVNISGSFAVSNSEKIRGEVIALVDDVWTSGATMSEAVAALKTSGAREVIGVAVARAGN
jgi:ComF family protein